jgi:ligand-binding sensor domain-containing protein/serine phosphatase RsbU (regulator of sigma subunit)
MAPVEPTPPTLARLSFWVPPGRVVEFGVVYQERIVPILKRHGLAESSQYPRKGPSNIFSRLFELGSPTEISEKQATLHEDPTWTRALRELGKILGITGSENPLQYSLRLYSTPTIPGQITPAGKGRGYWRTIDSTNGLAENRVFSVYQDREENLWFGTEGGVSRYDGDSFINFTIQNGLAHNTVLSILQDREENLWFGTLGGGVSRYDGDSFINFTTQNGLACDIVSSILQDREGNLWFGTGYATLEGKGVSRYNGDSFINFTTQNGLVHNTTYSILQDREGNLWFSTYGGGVSRYDGDSFINFTTQNGLAHNLVSSILQDREGNIWFGTVSGGVSRYDGDSFINFTTQNGLAHNLVMSTLQDREGNLWFGTYGGGVSRYDGDSFINFNTQNGLAHNSVMSALQDREGNLWFGTYGGGVSRYDGQTMTTFTTREGLIGNSVTCTLQDRGKNFWFGTADGGVSRYSITESEGRVFADFTEQDGLMGNVVRCIAQDRKEQIWIATLGTCISRYDGKAWTTFALEDGLPDCPTFYILEDCEGYLWFGTQGGGVSRYGFSEIGELKFETFTTEDGLAHDDVRCICQDREGNLWFGTFGGGVSRYSPSVGEGQIWTTFTTEDGLGSNHIQESAIFLDREGNLWFGTFGGGVSRYDGKSFATFTIDDGLAHNTVWSIAQDQEGHIWIGTGGGVNRYDGHIFQTLTQEDGIPGNTVMSVYQDQENHIWIGTTQGVTCYHSSIPSPPPVFVDSVVADRRYVDWSELSVPSHAGIIYFEFHGTNFKTRPGGMAYRYRLKGYDDSWKNTSQRRVEYQDLPIADYTFEVMAVDRDLVCSEQPATVQLRVIPDPRDEQIDELETRVRERTRQLEDTHRELQEAQTQLIDELEKELQTAHEMQMNLMPEASPRVEGLDIAGRCIPANHVGGDFFQYFLQQGRLILALADVTGHAMEAAIPVVMFSGILKSHMELEGTLQERFERLNRSLYGTLDRRTAICFVMGELDLSTRTFLLADGGCPYPYHYCAASGELAELQVSAYPLGVRPNTEYPVVETQLQPGDRLIFCSDGIVEADNEAGAQFGFEKTAEVIQKACSEGLSAEGIINQLLDEVASFKGDAPQSDDMTCVVVCAEKG